MAGFLGCRFLSFGAAVVVRDGKVSRVGYAINNWGGWPRALGNIVSAQSVHGPWLSFQRGYLVTSVDDESPQFRVSSGRSFEAEGPDDNSMSVRWTFDAPPELISHVFQIDLSCFWACMDAAQLATWRHCFGRISKTSRLRLWHA